MLTLSLLASGWDRMGNLSLRYVIQKEVQNSDTCLQPLLYQNGCGVNCYFDISYSDWHAIYSVLYLEIICIII